MKRTKAIKRHHVLWLVMLSLLMIMELGLMAITCNPAGEFRGASTYTIENNTQAVSDNQALGDTTAGILIGNLWMIILVAVGLLVLVSVGFKQVE